MLERNGIRYTRLVGVHQGCGCMGREYEEVAKMWKWLGWISATIGGADT